VTDVVCNTVRGAHALNATAAELSFVLPLDEVRQRR
jgi:hypothetical protein